MKRAPYYLAIINLSITIARVAAFVAIGLGQGWQGGAFAAVLASSVYVTTYFIRYKETRIWAVIGSVLAVSFDLWFNEVELIRTLSTSQMILPGSEFLGLSTAQLMSLMQASALVVGAVPTILAAVFGALQAGAERIVFLNKPSALSRIGGALAGMFSGMTVTAAAGLEIFVAKRWGNSENASLLPGELPKITGGNGTDLAVRWRDLTAQDIARIPPMSRGEMMAVYGVSDGTAGEWKRRVSSGERPWRESSEVIE